MDHAILKHLSIDRQAEYQEADNQKSEKERQGLDYQSMLAELKKKKIPDIAQENQPPPSFEEKKKLRENMFNFFEESTIEETRLVRFKILKELHLLFFMCCNFCVRKLK